MITLPFYINFYEWANTLFVDLPTLNIPIPSTENEWQLWGERLIEENALTTVPLPSNFEDWRIWAAYFVQNV